MSGLVEKLEAAEVGSRSLDQAVWLATGGWEGVNAPPSFTTSLDAALALAERLLPGQEYEITTLYGVARVGLNLNHGEDGGPFYGENVCGSVPLAVCAAAVKARALNLNETRHAE